MPYFVGILDGSGDAWGVRIPQLPGCHGGGGSAEAALADAISAVRAYAETASLPAPMSIDEIKASDTFDFDATSECLVQVPVYMETGRTVRANISVDAGALELIDEEADRRGLSRSAFLLAAVQEKIGLEYLMKAEGRLEAETGENARVIVLKPAG